MFLIIALFTALIFSQASAQEPFRCGTDAARRSNIANDPHILAREAELEGFIRQWIDDHRTERDADTIVLTIPVVFHILHVDGPENISNEQIFDAMEVLNRDYRRLNPDIGTLVPGYEGIAADVRLQFKLATIDPEGNCTNGIDRIRTVETFQGDNGSKLNQWRRDAYLNIWTVARIESGAAGYSQYPSGVEGTGFRYDGVLLLHDYVGRIGTSNESHSRALTHEVGHYLNLQHVWGDNNGGGGAPPGSMIATCGDDQVFDTPPTKGHSDCSNRSDYSCGSHALDSTYTFSQVVVGSGTNDPHGPFLLNDEFYDTTTVSFSTFTANGVSLNAAQGGAFAFSEWPSGALNGDSVYSELEGSLATSKYYEFTVTPSERRAMTLSSIMLKCARNEEGPRTFAIRSSVNGFSTNLAASVVPADPGLVIQPGNVFYFGSDAPSVVSGAKVTLTGSAYVKTVLPITFRIYAWNGEAGTGWFAVDDVVMNGTAGVLENVENYMEYSYCSKMFSQDQALRMRAALASPMADRSFLSTFGNLAATGTDGFTDRVCAPEADLYTYDQAIASTSMGTMPAGSLFHCIGEEVHFFDNSRVGIPTSWAWSFQDGNPSTSTERDPVVTFTSGGWKTVSLTVANGQGSSTVTQDSTVNIAAPWPDLQGALHEDFESAASEDLYFVENFEGDTSKWERATNAGFESSASMRINAYPPWYLPFTSLDGGDVNDIDAFTTPTMDLTWLHDGHLTFRYSYAVVSPEPGDLTESLEVWSSSDCGGSWVRRFDLVGTELITNGLVADYYVPPANIEAWALADFVLPTSLTNDQVRFKFVYRSSRASNNLYIDDINITGTVGLNEMNANTVGLFLSPNPVDGVVAISYTLPFAGAGVLQLLDAQGRLIWSSPTHQVAQERITVDTRALSLGAGVYTVQLRHMGGARSERLMVR
jgi:PKD repeat protein